VDFKSDLLFKDTIKYIDEVFESLGISYDSMGFMFSSGDVKKIVAKYPALEKYIKTHDVNGRELDGDMTSARIDENGNYTLRVDKTEHHILRELVSKTPRPYSFGAIAVFLDNVQWFPEINTTPCIVGQPPNSYFPGSYKSNCVILAKYFNTGKKRNPVFFTIEVGDEATGIIDVTELEGKLSSVFGKPFGTKYFQSENIFYFSDNEKAHLNKQNKIFSKLYDPLINELFASVNNAKGIQHIKQDPFTNRPPGLSLVKALKKIFPVKKYKHRRAGGLFVAERTNENNHTFALGCDIPPFMNQFYAQFSIFGHNFNYTTDINNIRNSGFCSIFPGTQEELEYHIANLASALNKAEECLSDELLKLYGKSIVY